MSVSVPSWRAPMDRGNEDKGPPCQTLYGECTTTKGCCHVI